MSFFIFLSLFMCSGEKMSEEEDEYKEEFVYLFAFFPSLLVLVTSYCYVIFW